MKRTHIYSRIALSTILHPFIEAVPQLLTEDLPHIDQRGLKTSTVTCPFHSSPNAAAGLSPPPPWNR